MIRSGGRRRHARRSGRGSDQLQLTFTVNGLVIIPAIGFFMSAPDASPVMVYVPPSTLTSAEPTFAPMVLVTARAFPSTVMPSESTVGGFASVIMTASPAWPLIAPLATLILPPC